MAEKFEYRPGPERVQALCDLLGNPERDLRFIHIAGTNGKGSTACMTASVLSEAGIRTGMFTSPAVCGVRDQYRIDGKMIGEDDYLRLLSRIDAANDILAAKRGERATPFERDCALAFAYFSENHCDAVVLECGMGGRDDATNIVRNKICCVITSVSYDHMQYLGNTLYEIASAKAGIITSDCPVVALDSSPEAMEAIEERCALTGSRLYRVKPDGISFKYTEPTGMSVSYKEFRDVRIPLTGSFQAENAALALRTLSVIEEGGMLEGFILNRKVLSEGLMKAVWPFRFECLCRDPLIYADGAHNPDAALKLRDTIEKKLAGYKIILVMGMFADKDYEQTVKILAGTASAIFTVDTPDSERALPAVKLAETAGKFCKDVRACAGIREAYGLAADAARDEKTAVIACGSLSYLNDFSECCIHGQG
ncbi:MAG: bifunctional folylpolyglutamate synthase/dihydrofolate synthase [Lachnospiraceae bacterium]|nr:bifunctional folylpolyglutamate synthase/dihydrofolate synthase [Lachnospiraceae bacterium]